MVKKLKMIDKQISEVDVNKQIMDRKRRFITYFKMYNPKIYVLYRKAGGRI